MILLYVHSTKYQIKVKVAQSALSPLMKVELGMLSELEVANSVHQLAKFTPADPREDENVHPHFQW